MPQEALGLGPFVEALEERLNALPAEQLRAVLLDHAARLPAADRAEFLAMFRHRRDVVAATSTGEAVGGADPTLVADVEAFAADVESGTYAQGYGYDPEYGDYRTFGDEAWTSEFDGLIEGAGGALLAGDVGTAREAYRRLFEVLGCEYDGGGLPGAGMPEELVRTDVTEAKHRYLRATWESEPVETRAAAVIAAVEEAAYIGGRVSLAALEGTRREPLPDVDVVLPDLIAQLQGVPNGYGFGAQARDLLAEVTERHRGVDGLAGLARIPGDHQAEAYRDWIDGLVRAGRLDDAEAAATEGLDRLGSAGRWVAAIAERLATLAAGRGDDAAVLDAHRAAWRADPSLARLLALADVATSLDCLDAVVGGEADQAGHGPLSQQPDLAAGLLLLAGRVDHAVLLLDSADPVRWDHGHPGSTVVAFLLAGASGATHHQQWRDLLLFDLIDRADDAGWHHSHLDPDDGLAILREAITAATPATPATPASPASPGGRYHTIAQDELLLSALLTQQLDRTRLDSTGRRRWLQTARAKVEERMEAVVAGQQRGAYGRVAHLATACAEALTLALDPTAAQRFLDDLHARYPRHSAFRRELRAMVAQSPVLMA